MKLKISKVEQSGKTELSVNFVTSTGTVKFDYIKMIELLYKQPSDVIEFDYSDSVTDEEKEKIQEMFEEIKKVAVENEKSFDVPTSVKK